MSTPLSTYLATAATGAPSTTALDLVCELTPVQWVDGNGLEQYNPTTVEDLITLEESQAKWAPALYPQPSVATPYGVTGYAITTLNVQAIKELKAKLPIGLTTTTNGSGTSTIDLTSYGFSAAPVVQLTPTSNTLAYVSALSSTSLTVTGAATSTVHVVLVPQ